MYNVLFLSEHRLEVAKESKDLFQKIIFESGAPLRTAEL